jgi:uracil DNA glycosylase
VLTVKAANANSHKDRGWEKFTDAVIAWINKNSTGVVFMLWGSYAQKKGACIDKVSTILYRSTWICVVANGLRDVQDCFFVYGI